MASTPSYSVPLKTIFTPMEPKVRHRRRPEQVGALAACAQPRHISPPHMTASWHTLLEVAIRTSVVYLALLVGLRLTGTRQLGQMSTFDLVLLLIIANAVQNAMVGPDTSLAGGLVAAGVLIGWHRLIDWWRVRSRGVAKLLAGEGIMLIHNGQALAEHLRRAGITRDELRQALREHG